MLANLLAASLASSLDRVDGPRTDWDMYVGFKPDSGSRSFCSACPFDEGVSPGDFSDGDALTLLPNKGSPPKGSDDGDGDTTAWV